MKALSHEELINPESLCLRVPDLSGQAWWLESHLDDFTTFAADPGKVANVSRIR